MKSHPNVTAYSLVVGCFLFTFIHSACSMAQTTKHTDLQKKIKLPVIGQPLSDAQAVAILQLGLHGLDRQYPNKPSNVIHDAKGVLSPKEMHPAFYGCFDWHSSVHGHWVMVRLLKTQTDLSNAKEIRARLDAHLTKENIQKELDYFKLPLNKSFERMYGWAWYLRLVAELHNFQDEQGQKWREACRPLEVHLVQSTLDYMKKLRFPIRTGVHPNTAFALAQIRDYAEIVGNQKLIDVIDAKGKEFFLDDKNYPVMYEPSGEDFFSAGLNEADLMRRVLSHDHFVKWLDEFLPELINGKAGNLLKPVKVTDITDGKLVHLAGLNLNRAWTLRGIASSLKDGDPRKAVLLKSGKEHSAAGIYYVFSGDYAGEHWLGTFAIYVLTEVGVHNSSHDTNTDK